MEVNTELIENPDDIKSAAQARMTSQSLKLALVYAVVDDSSQPRFHNGVGDWKSA